VDARPATGGSPELVVGPHPGILNFRVRGRTAGHDFATVQP
jgi:hypothetical protein